MSLLQPRLVAPAVAGIVLLGGVALPAGSAEAAVRSTRVSGWTGSTLVASPGQVVRLRVAVRPVRKAAGRTVVLQRRTSGTGWSDVATTRTRKNGVATLRLPTARAFDGQVRLWVTATRKARSVATPARHLVVRSSAAASGPVPATTSTEREVIRLVNVARASARTCGSQRYAAVPPLRVDDRLSKASRDHALDMGRQDYFDHESLDGRSPWDRAEAAGTTANAENIAAGQPTPAAVVQSWLQSEGHCRNIMSPGSTRVGVGFADVPGSDWETYWVQMFGR